jgi:hypothetical protein
MKSKKKKKNKETQLTSQPANQVIRLRKTHRKQIKKITMLNFQQTQC